MAIETASDLANFVEADEFGQAATYTPPSGSAVSCTVHRIEGVNVIDGQSGEVIDTVDVLWFRRSEVDDPARDGTVLLGSTTYRIQQIHERDRNMVAVRVRQA